MDVCGNCGRTRKQGAAFCSGCGRRFADDGSKPARPDNSFGVSGSSGPTDPAGSAGRSGAGGTRRCARSDEPAESGGPAGPYRSVETHGPAGPYGPTDTYGPRGGPQRDSPSKTEGTRLASRSTVLVTTVILFAAAAVATGVMLYVSHHASHGQTVRNSAHSAPITPSAHAPSASGQSSSAPAQGPSGGPPGSSDGSAVTVGAGASQNPNASSVAAFLGQYFAAINAHDYQSYRSLLSPQLRRGMTHAQFDEGYRSTVDSNEKLVGISTAPDGDLAAEVTFTSHQDPADSPDHSESCTKWHVLRFLGRGSSGWVIDPAPSGYHTSYKSCS
jgi:hypothetical protein